MTEKDFDKELKEESCTCRCNHEEVKENKEENCGCGHDHEEMKHEDDECSCGHDHEEVKDEEGCSCGHDHNHEGHDHEHDDFEDFEIITLTLDDDSELDCAVMNIFEVEEQSYIALLPLGGEEDDEEKEVLLYRFNELEKDEIEINMIESEDEFDKVAEVYYEINQEMEDEDFEDEEFEDEDEDEVE